MSEAKFTPGPWVSDKDNADWGLFAKDGPIITANYTSCVEVHNHFDMSLIAAAPELYEALDTLLHAAENDYGVTASTLDDAREILAKARGES